MKECLLCSPADPAHRDVTTNRPYTDQPLSVICVVLFSEWCVQVVLVPSPLVLAPLAVLQRVVGCSTEVLPGHKRSRRGELAKGERAGDAESRQSASTLSTSGGVGRGRKGVHFICYNTHSYDVCLSLLRVY